MELPTLNEKIMNPAKKKSHVTRKSLYDLADKIYADYRSRCGKLPHADSLFKEMIRADESEAYEYKLNLGKFRGIISYRDYDGNQQKLSYESFKRGLTPHRKKYM